MLLKTKKQENLPITLNLGLTLRQVNLTNNTDEGSQLLKKPLKLVPVPWNKVQQKGAIKYTNWTYKQFMEEIFMPNFYSTTSLDIEKMRSAKKHGLIFHELSTANVDPIPIVKKPVDFWTKPEFETIIKSLDRDSYFEQFIFTLLWLYYFTGMRVNEATTLYLEDIDFDRKTLTISHNLQYVNRQNWVRHNKLKTESSRRIIGLDDKYP